MPILLGTIFTQNGGYSTLYIGNNNLANGAALSITFGNATTGGAWLVGTDSTPFYFSEVNMKTAGILGMWNDAISTTISSAINEICDNYATQPCR